MARPSRRNTTNLSSSALDSAEATLPASSQRQEPPAAADQSTAAAERDIDTALWRRQALLAATLRLLLARTGIAKMLQQRIEIATPITSLWRLRQALHPLHSPISPCLVVSSVIENPYRPPLPIDCLQIAEKEVHASHFYTYY